MQSDRPPADEAHGLGVVIRPDDGRLVGEDDLSRVDVPLGHHEPAHAVVLACKWGLILTTCHVLYLMYSQDDNVLLCYVYSPIV